VYNYPMWTCPTCQRIFQKTNQPHSCKKVPLEKHFKNKELAKDLFDQLFSQINQRIGPCKAISLPCCVHLFGTYDFLAALPKKDGLEIRIALNRQIDSSRLVQSVPLSTESFKNCFFIRTRGELDSEFLSWLKESYDLKN
jgi:hypothetical protein